MEFNGESEKGGEGLDTVHEALRGDVKSPIKELLGNNTLLLLEQSGEFGIDTIQEVEELEKGYRALSYIRNFYFQPDLSDIDRALAPLYSPMHSVDIIGNQFSKRILPAFLLPDRDEALRSLRDIEPNTTQEEMVMLINDEQFDVLHSGLHTYLVEASVDIAEVARDRVENVFPEVDKNQFNDSVDRSLERMLGEGLVFRISPSASENIHSLCVANMEDSIPLIERIKNEQVLDVSGFEGAKISLAVHDAIDHVWTFNLFRRVGLLEKFQHMFTSIGNPELTDMFKREGEAVASISFGIRYFQNQESGFGPLFRTSHIEEHMDTLLVDGKLQDRHMEAYRVVKSMKRGSQQWQSLGFVFSNYIAELDEQRRKHGKIKERDPRTREIKGELDPFSPDYLSFLIEAHHELLKPSNKHRNSLFRFHILMEEYLANYVNGDIDKTRFINIPIDKIDQIDLRGVTIPPTRIQWMFRNFGFTATREGIV